MEAYRFNGKESQKFAGLPYLYYGSRFYHPLSSRWTTMDPLAEKYYSISPYAYCSGNPVNFAIEREQKELAHFAEREQRKDPQGLNFVDWDGNAWYFSRTSGRFMTNIDDDGDKIYIITQRKEEMVHAGKTDWNKLI
ncbi:MAG: hypothetical protein K2H95_00875 [Bacteroidales bacterium]|nr:hypothetical protein [Bacteroidales bacterium]